MQPVLKIARAGKGARRPWAGTGLGLPQGGPCKPRHISLTHKGARYPRHASLPGSSPPTGSLFGSKWLLLLPCPSQAFLQEANGKVVTETPYREASWISCPHLQAQPPSGPARLCELSLSLSLNLGPRQWGLFWATWEYLKTWLGLLPGEQEVLPSTRPS